MTRSEQKRRWGYLPKRYRNIGQAISVIYTLWRIAFAIFSMAMLIILLFNPSSVGFYQGHLFYENPIMASLWTIIGLSLLYLVMWAILNFISLRILHCILHYFFQKIPTHELTLILLGEGGSRQAYEVSYQEYQHKIDTIESNLQAKLEQAVNIQDSETRQVVIQEAQDAKRDATRQANQELESFRNSLLEAEGLLDYISSP